MILLIDKPKGWTSHDVVAKIRGILHERRVGHAGTLDPNATGLLIVGTGRDTKKLGEITTNTRKTYEAEIFLGETRDTDDVDGTPLRQGYEGQAPNGNDIKRVLGGFAGEQMQVPPQFSAIKMNGKKAYELARKGIEAKLTPRKINIYKIKLIEYDFPVLKIVCEVTAGTYIRSLARDIGEKLGTGAFLKELRRTQVGEFSVQKAISLQQLQQQQQS